MVVDVLMVGEALYIDDYDVDEEDEMFLMQFGFDVDLFERAMTVLEKKFIERRVCCVVWC